MNTKGKTYHIYIICYNFYSSFESDLKIQYIVEKLYITMFLLNLIMKLYWKYLLWKYWFQLWKNVDIGYGVSFSKIFMNFPSVTKRLTSLDWIIYSCFWNMYNGLRKYSEEKFGLIREKFYECITCSIRNFLKFH